MRKNGTAFCYLDEQETVIRYGRTEDYADVSTSDTTQKTKFNKLCSEHPKHWKKIKEDEVFSFYRCTPKTLISARSKVTERNFTDEQRQAMASRLVKSRQNKS